MKAILFFLFLLTPYSSQAFFEKKEPLGLHHIKAENLCLVKFASYGDQIECDNNKRIILKESTKLKTSQRILQIDEKMKEFELKRTSCFGEGYAKCIYEKIDHH